MKNFKLNLKKKLNRKGFTLAELLVVVAILGILVAISVPLFSSRLEAAKKSTDEANARAAKAVAAALMMEDTALTGGVDGDHGVYYYDAENGTLEDGSAITAYSKSAVGTQIEGVSNAIQSEKDILKVGIDRALSTITLTWTASTKS